MVGLVFIMLFEIVIFIVILICCLVLLPYLKLRIWREISVPTVEITFESISIINILSLTVIVFRLGEVVIYGNFFPSLQEPVSLTAPVITIKLVSVFVSMLLIVIVESFAFSLLFYSLKRYTSYPTILGLVSLANIPTIFFVFIRTFDISLGLYSRSLPHITLSF